VAAAPGASSRENGVRPRGCALVVDPDAGARRLRRDLNPRRHRRQRARAQRRRDESRRRGGGGARPRGEPQRSGHPSARTRARGPPATRTVAAIGADRDRGAPARRARDVLRDGGHLGRGAAQRRVGGGAARNDLRVPAAARVPLPRRGRRGRARREWARAPAWARPPPARRRPASRWAVSWPPGISFVGTCPGAGSARRATTSLIAAGRSSGFLASITATSSSSADGTVGSSDETRGGACPMCATMTSAGPLPRNGGRP
jgi:hypothetical protein